jgi:hypothetical protein
MRDIASVLSFHLLSFVVGLDFHLMPARLSYFLTGSDNTQYDGEWRANMRQGIGTALYEDGR